MRKSLTIVSTVVQYLFTYINDEAYLYRPDECMPNGCRWRKCWTTFTRTW